MAENEPKPIETFEASLEELEKVVRELEGGDLALERSLELFERGMALSDDMLIRNGNKMTAEPFRPEKS
jgi:exodeoxyribonuclease VII small subunit